MTQQPRPIPDALTPVLTFVNSLDIEEGTDEWAGGPAALEHWFASVGLAQSGVRCSAATYQLALDLRTGLRAMALANNGVPPPAAEVATLTRALNAFPLVVQPRSDGGSDLVGQHRDPAMAVLDRIVHGYAVGVVTGQWSRIRQCPASDCAWIFWDFSAKGARRWCTMRVCGNRAKARAFVARRRARADT